MIESHKLLMRFDAGPRRTSPVQTTSILVGGSIVLAIWIVVTASINGTQQTAVQQLMIVLLSGIATMLLCGLVSESRRRAQREIELAAEQAKLEATNLQLEESKGRAETASTAKSLFLANMGHELRTPLNAIIGFSAIIKKETVGQGPAAIQKCAEYADDIFDSGQRLLALIENILDISKIDAGKMSLDEEPIEIADLVNASVAHVLHQRGNHNLITLETNLPKEAPLFRGDKLKLSRVLINLLSNGIKFTPEGGRVAIRFELAPQGELVISVSDTGIGMSPDEITIALEPFAQVDNALDKHYEGTGIGLPLAKRLVELHGGTLAIESVKDVGTIVRTYLPADRVIGRAKVAPMMNAS
jgi:two-component system cell cycle sensor histidine kinase PleC